MIIYLAILTTFALAAAIKEKHKDSYLAIAFWAALVLGLGSLTVVAWHVGAHIEQ